MVVNALQRAPVSKLVKALEIISERYIDAFQKHDQLPLQLVKSITIAQPQLQPQWQNKKIQKSMMKMKKMNDIKLILMEIFMIP